MVFLEEAQQTKTGAYSISNSLRFNGADTAYLHRNQATPTNSKIFTYSVWVKRAALDGSQLLYGGFPAGSGSSINDTYMQFQSTTVHRIFLQNAISDSTDFGKRTNVLYRDCSAWYNIVMAVDTTDGSIGNRIKLYTNGVQTDWDGTYAADDGPDEDLILNFNVATTGGNQNQHRISNSYNPANFYIAEAVFIDGQQLTPSSFAETDSDSGIWKPKSVSSLTFGDNGWYLEFKNSAVGTGASDTVGADTSGNDNHFTTSGFATTDHTTDTPTNNFCTLNTVAKGADVTLSEGGLKYASSIQKGTVGTMGVTSGKWYFEAKAVDVGGDTQIGVYDGTDGLGWPDNYLGVNTSSWGMISGNGKTIHGGSLVSYGDSVSDNDIIMVAVDMDNDKWFAGENGTWHNSGDPAAGDNPANGGIDDGTGTIFPAISNNSPNNIDWQFNFGNPIYANSSDAADANGYGAFEYAPPTGFYALCTKNLAEFGG